MEIRNRETGAVITDTQFRNDNPGTSFPKVITEDVLNGFGYDPVFNGPAASITAPYQVSVRDGVEQIEGKWYTKFIAGPVFATSDEEAAYRASVDAAVAERVRAERARKLAACDWTVLTDSPLTTAKKTEWKTYRTALRDISAAEGFPHTMEWPTEPS